MTLKKLYIHNYKSFYHTTIELDKFNIIIGENNSGKSNLIDVLEFIDIASNENLDKAIIAKGGLEKILNYNYDEKKIIIELDLEDNDFRVKVRFTINLPITIISVIIYGKSADELFPLHINASRNNSNSNKMKAKVYSCIDNILELNLSEELFILQFELKNILSSISKTYAFNTHAIRNESHKEATKVLQKDGANLGKTLYEIKKKYPHCFEAISNSMIGIINEIDGIDVQEMFGNYLIGFKEQSQEVGIDIVSDGTINLLATITALNQDEDKSLLLAFGEPERYLHLKAVNYLLDSFRASQKQILITTHSTEILKDANLEEIIFIYRDSDGDTQSIKATDILNLEGKMERLGYDRPLSLDELIADGIIGDFE